MRTEYDLYPGADLSAAPPCDLLRSRRITSSEIIAWLEMSTRYDRASAARVVDGFWDYVADVERHYFDRGTCRLLVIPHFGTFTWRPYAPLAFKSPRLLLPKKPGVGGLIGRLFGAKPPPKDEGPAPPTSAGVLGDWCRRRIDHPGGLSVKRKIAWTIARDSGLPLDATAEILEALLLAMLAAFTRTDTKIVWAGRGTMKPTLITGKINPRTLAPVPDRFRWVFKPAREFLSRLRQP